MQKEFLNIDEVLQILNINSKIYLSSIKPLYKSKSFDT